jgi:NAD:arginine ADP-ribosyltransferase
MRKNLGTEMNLLLIVGLLAISTPVESSELAGSEIPAMAAQIQTQLSSPNQTPVCEAEHASTNFADWMLSHPQSHGYAWYRDQANSDLSSRTGCQQYLNLKDDYKVALRAYTLDAFRDINSALRSSTLQERSQVAPFTDALSQALSHLQTESGTVYRCTKLPAQVLESYKVGNEVIQDAYTSTSTNSNWFEGSQCLGFGNIHFTIHTTKAHQIYCFSLHWEENEWLIDKGAKFVVRSRVDSPDGSDISITLDQVP